MNPAAFFALLGGGVWYLEYRRKAKMRQGETASAADPGGNLPDLIDCSPMTMDGPDVTAWSPPMAIQIGQTVNLCGAAEMDAMVFTMANANALPSPAPADAYERNGDYFRFLKSGSYAVGTIGATPQENRAWLLVTDDLIPCVKGGTPADPQKVMGMKGWPVKLCDLVEADFTILVDSQTKSDAYTVDGENFTPLEKGRFVVTRTMGGGPVWDIVVQDIDLTPSNGSTAP